MFNTTPSLFQVVGEWLFSYFFMSDEDDGPEAPSAPALVEGCQMSNPFDSWPIAAGPAANGYPRNSSESVSGFLITLPYMLQPGFDDKQAVPASARLISAAEIATLPPPVPVFAPFGRTEQPTYLVEPGESVRAPESLPSRFPSAYASMASTPAYANQGAVYQAVASLPAPVNPSGTPCWMRAEKDGDQYVVAVQRGGMSMLCTKLALAMGAECRLQVGAANRRIVVATKQFEAVADLVETHEEEGRLILVGRATLLYKKNGEPCRVEADKIMLDVSKGGFGLPRDVGRPLARDRPRKKS